MYFVVLQLVSGVLKRWFKHCSEEGQVSTNEPRCEKTDVRGLRPDPAQTGLCSNRRSLGGLKFRI